MTENYAIPIQAPKRRFQFELEGGADDVDGVIRDLLYITGEIRRGNLTDTVWGSSSSGGSFRLIEDETMNHDRYVADLRVYLAGSKSQEGTND